MNLHANSEREHHRESERWSARHAHGRIPSLLISVVSFLRGLPLFMAARPKTPLRVLCVMAFDTLHVLHTSRRLPLPKLRILATLLDFGACANAAFDNKVFCWKEYRATRRMLDAAGIRSSVVEFLRRFRELERIRPPPGGDPWHFQKVRAYREAVVRLSLGMVATTAIGNQCLDEGIRATYCDDDLKVLFRIVMQCQIIDDVVDYSKDTSAGLPSFLTATESLAHAFELTRLARLQYADDRDLPQTDDLFPLRLALLVVSACAKLVVLLGRWRQRPYLVQQLPERGYGSRLVPLRTANRIEPTPPILISDTTGIEFPDHSR